MGHYLPRGVQLALAIYDKILNKYNMDEYDAYTLLQRGGARLPIDSLEFIDPILENETGDIKRKF